jgi:putative ATPase
VLQDRNGEHHYDTASALIKSMRASDADAAMHYLARMLEGGEDVAFIARRLVIFASEDVGNAAPLALVVTQAAADAVRFVGMPEAQLPLAQAVSFLACAPKSRACTTAIETARHDLRQGAWPAIPSVLLNRKRPHESPGNEQGPGTLLPKALAGRVYYPTTEGKHEHKK